MNTLLSLMWFLIGIIWTVAGKPFLEVCACFLICGVFSGASELAIIRKELESVEEDYE